VGRLYVIATPIGNLEDMSARAARILREVKMVVAEDTREARKLLAHAGATTRLASFHAHSGRAALAPVLRALGEGDVAYVTDAGTPAVSDPGPELVRAAVAAGHDVVSVPGPSAVTAALAVSGMPADSFLFLGFPPRRPADRRNLLRRGASAASTLVLFEAPHRLAATLQDILGTLGDRPIVVCRELTKLFEETFRGTVSQAIQHFTAPDTGPRGEFVLVIDAGAPVEEDITDGAITGVIDRLQHEGLRGRGLVDAATAETGAARSRVYRLALAPGPDHQRPEPRGAGPA
jgi:16S rRNA (cytidine1402-2'-O)-methyltransferase